MASSIAGLDAVDVRSAAKFGCTLDSKLSHIRQWSPVLGVVGSALHWPLVQSEELGRFAR